MRFVEANESVEVLQDPSDELTRAKAARRKALIMASMQDTEAALFDPNGGVRNNHTGHMCGDE